MSYAANKLTELKTWWNTPVTPADRNWASLLGAWAGLWLGIIGRLIIAGSATLGELFWSAVGTAVAFAIAGYFFPKIIRCIALPFAYFGPTFGN